MIMYLAFAAWACQTKEICLIDSGFKKESIREDEEKEENVVCQRAVSSNIYELFSNQLINAGIVLQHVTNMYGNQSDAGDKQHLCDINGLFPKSWG